MPSLLTPKFSFDWKSPSCNANAINVVFTGRDMHMHTDTQRRTENVSCLFIICCLHDGDTKWGGTGSQRNQLPTYFLFFYFFHTIIFIFLFLIRSTERKKWEEAGTRAASYLVTRWPFCLYLLVPETHAPKIHTHICIGWALYLVVLKMPLNFYH